MDRTGADEDDRPGWFGSSNPVVRELVEAGFGAAVGALVYWAVSVISDSWAGNESWGGAARSEVHDALVFCVCMALATLVCSTWTLRRRRLRRRKDDSGEMAD